MLAHSMLFAFGFMTYTLQSSLSDARATYTWTYMVARSSAVVLQVDSGLILFPVCRTLISYMRQTPLNGIIQFDKNITFHKLVAWSIVLFSWVHTIAHLNNVAQLAAKNHLGFKGFLRAGFTLGPTYTGWVMLVALMAMVFTSIDKTRRANYERFWYTHHLFIIFFVFWSFHGNFCMIPANTPPYCGLDGRFYLYWMVGGFVYLAERIFREIRGRHQTTISKVIQHPSSVVEIQIKKEKTKPKAGQYIFLCCPEISLWQYHPFTLTSAPEEDYISVHIRCVGDFTKSLARVLGCDFENEKKGKTMTITDEEHPDQTVGRVLPRVYIDGPFGSASEDIFKYEVAMLVGAGIGVTPFASLLKSIWYHMNGPRNRTRLQKVYFFWICRDFGSFEWFRSLLFAIEEQDLKHRIEIHTYLTAKIKADDATNIMVNDVNADRDAITGLRAPTSFGRPRWDDIFQSVREVHSPAEVGVFFCGPKGLGSQLHVKCNQHSTPDLKFVWGKENF